MTDTPPPQPDMPRQPWWRRAIARLPFGREHLVFVIAGLIGCAGALSTILFRECLRQLQWWLSGTDQGLVATARALKFLKRAVKSPELVARLEAEVASTWRGSCDVDGRTAVASPV